jgi:hypothetical protein
MKTYQPNLIESEWKKPDLTASDLTAYALEIFRLWKWRVRRVNNIPSNKGHRGHIQKGWPDLQGYTNNALAVLCEVKKSGDTFSQEQYDRLEDCLLCGGEAWVCVDIKGAAHLIKFDDYKTNIKLPRK